MSSELSSGSNPTTPSLSKKKGLDGPAPKAEAEDTSDVALGEDGMPLNPGEQTVQFISSGQDPVNGDAKVEIGDHHGAPKFVGLGKEELMKYANDPFWVRLRWVLFILFWLIWLAMLAGAIVIILYAPKCSDKFEGPTPGPYYQIYLDRFVTDGKFQGIDGNYIDHLKTLGVSSVIVSQFLSDGGAAGLSSVVDFTAINPNYGNLEQFKDLVTKLKKEGIEVLIQIIPNHSSLQHNWFAQNSTFYVIEDTTTANTSTWKTVLKNSKDGDAWDFVSTSNEAKKYLHQFDKGVADLDYENPKVINEMNKVLQFWFDTGISGFLLSDVSYLVEDRSKLQDQKATINNRKNVDIIKKLIDSTDWKLTRNDSKEEDSKPVPYVLLDVNNMNLDDSINYYSKNTIPVSTSLLELKQNFTAVDLKEVLEKTYEKIPAKNPVTWRLSGPRFLRQNQQYGSQERADALNTVAYMLRGQVITYYGDEYRIQGSPSNRDELDITQETFSLDTARRESSFYKSLINAHNQLNQTNAGGGSTEYHVSSDTPNIFIMERSVNEKSYIVAANFGSETKDVSIKSIIGDKTAKVVVSTPNLVSSSLKVNSTVSDTASLPGLSGVILSVE